MIGSLRKQTQKSGLKIIMWLTLFSLVGGSFIGLIRFSKKLENPLAVATVGDEEISLAEFRRRALPIANFVQEIKKRYGAQAQQILALWGATKDPERMALDQLIQEKTIQNAANALDLHISKEYTEKKLQDPLFVRESLGHLIPAQALEQGTLNLDILAQYLQRQGITEQEFDSLIEQALKAHLFNELAQGSAYVPKEAVKDLYNKLYSKKKLGILSLPLDEYIKKAQKQPATEEELKNYFTQHQENYRVPEKRDARLWTFSQENYGIQVTEKEIENYYNKSKAKFVAKPTEIQVRRILLKGKDSKDKEVQQLVQELIKNPEKFEEIAQKQSQASEKGKVLTIKRGEKEPLFEQAAFALTEKNAISPAIKTPEGIEIIQLISKKEAQYKDLESVKGEIEKQLGAQKFQGEFTTSGSRILQQAQDAPEIFERFVSQKKAKESSVNGASKENAGIQTERLFGLTKPTDKAFYFENNKGFILELKKIEKSFIPEFNKVKEKIAQDYYRFKAQEKLAQDLTEAQNKLARESLEKIAGQLKGQYETTEFINPQEEDSSKKLKTKDIPLQQALYLNQEKESTKEITDRGGYLIQVLEMEKVNQSELEKKKKELQRELYHNETQQIYQSLLTGLQAKTPVTTNSDLLKRAGVRM